MILISTKTSLGSFFEAARSVEKELGIKLNLDVVYVGDLDRLDPEGVASRVSKADVLLVDIRGLSPATSKAP